ncbi:MAG: hypothetical protein ACR2PM_20770 [Hyphomicrobiales bacterium]
MTSGFTTWKDVLDVVGIPVALGLLAIVWSPIESWYRCRRFRRLAGRELEEIGPRPEEPVGEEPWTAHLQKSFLHQRIIEQISENRDFVLGLNPSFVYSVSQLWKSYDDGDGTQWLWYLEELARHRYLLFRKKKILEIHDKWKVLIEAKSPATARDPDGKNAH